MKHKIGIFFLLSFFCWFLPFIARLFFFDIPEINTDYLEFDKNSITGTMDRIVQSVSENNRKDAFAIIFFNNLKGCLLNIVGGVMLGLGTFINLIFNGFFSADIFANAYKSGLGIEAILKVTLPHSFELIGFWLSGSLGFYVASEIIQFIRGKENFTKKFYKKIGLFSIIVFVIILSAAYVEAYISSSM